MNLLKTQLTKIINFDAAHSLPKYLGKCHRLHGHTYKVEITVEGKVKDDPDKHSYGMVLDFAVLKDLMEQEINRRYDHKCLNDIMEYSTTELLAKEIFKNLESKLPVGVDLVGVRIWESDSSNVYYGR